MRFVHFLFFWGGGFAEFGKVSVFGGGGLINFMVFGSCLRGFVQGVGEQAGSNVWTFGTFCFKGFGALA